MEGLTYELILGREWCTENGLVLDFGKSTLRISDEEAACNV